MRGKSGADKTTLLKVMGLLEAVDEDEVKLFGVTVNKLEDGEKSRLRLHHIGFVFQFFNLIPSLTVSENIELPLALARKSKKERKTKIVVSARAASILAKNISGCHFENAVFNEN